MIGDMRALRSFALLVPALAPAFAVGCFDAAVDVGAVIDCGSDVDCPPATRCEEFVERCVPLGLRCRSPRGSR
jgi:hypothetical protein